MGPKLADNILQGNAGPDEFRTAPLWGLGQRIFLLHDGRTTDLVQAIQAHSSGGNSWPSGLSARLSPASAAAWRSLHRRRTGSSRTTGSWVMARSRIC